MQDILSTGDAITLHTGMSDREFAQANLIHHLKEPGYIVRPLAESTAPYSITEWYFDKTSSQDGIFTVSGNAFDGTILYDVLSIIQEETASLICTKPGKAQTLYWPLLLAVLNAMKAAQAAGVTLPSTGPIGIIVSDNGSVLFLPTTILSRAISFRSQEDASRLFESWRQPVLPLDQEPAFTAATIIYTAISGKAAFTAITPERLTEDFFDQNYIPLQYIASVKPELCESVNNMLKSKTKYRLSIEKLCNRLPQTIAELFDTVTETATLQALSTFTKNQNAHIGRIRLFRKNITTITICSILFLIVTGVCLSIAKTNAERPNTIGLTAYQTVESFYSSYNHLDTIGLDACITKSAGKPFSSMITNLYVFSKMQSAYSQTLGYLTPAQWLLVPNKKQESVFGLSQFSIDGKPADSSAEWFFNVNKDVPVSTDGETETMTATYYLAVTEGENIITITYLRDTVTLEFQKNRWIITAIERKDKSVDFDAERFFTETADTTQTDVLQNAYEWIPTDAEITAAKKELAERKSF